MTSIKFNLKAFALYAVLFMSLFGFATSSMAKKEFAEHKVVLQISDPNPFKQKLVLNVANNILKHYGPDLVEVEIVAFGPGLRLLFKNNVSSGRIQGLVDNGVRFSACSNTIKSMTKKLGHAPALNPNAVKVAAGVVRILDLEQDGYTLIKP
ncbi:MAG: hypothetical protein GXP11_03165 [Gammaproteobacteria bacterium]|nr:hypothetical protein [Gammaproteobacteria bacterium]